MADDDTELAAMALIARSLGTLSDDAARKRVVGWLADKFGMPPVERQVHAVGSLTSLSPEGSSRRFDTFAELFDAVQPSTGKERALVAAYWRTVVEGAAQFQSSELNVLLTDLGHRSSNITDALTGSMQEKPALILQIKKSGKSQQSRKTYKMSTPGIRWVEARLEGGDA